MLVPFNLTALTTFTATTLVCERSLTNTHLLDIIAYLPDMFGYFFSTKIQRLRDEHATSRQPDFSVFCGPTLETFSLVTEQQVKNIILKAPEKSCMLDPVPTYLVHECLDDLIPTITAIINESLVSGIVLQPPPFKQAIVLPLLKKA